MEKTKTCMKCGAEKPLVEFYPDSRMKDGHLNKCKVCTREDVRRNREAKAEYYREYDRLRFQNDPQVSERHKRYKKTPKGKAAMRRAKERWKKQNPVKRAAHVILNNAIKGGRLEKEPCVKCGDPKVHAHHEDYSKPLEVIWLCAKHHHRLHASSRSGIRSAGGATSPWTGWSPTR